MSTPNQIVCESIIAQAEIIGIDSAKKILESNIKIFCQSIFQMVVQLKALEHRNQKDPEVKSNISNIEKALESAEASKLQYEQLIKDLEAKVKPEKEV